MVEKSVDYQEKIWIASPSKASSDSPDTWHRQILQKNIDKVTFGIFFSSNLLQLIILEYTVWIHSMFSKVIYKGYGIPIQNWIFTVIFTVPTLFRLEFEKQRTKR